MSPPILLDLHFHDWLGLFVHFLLLSLLAVGGAVATIPDMHRYLVVQNGWLSDPQFAGSLAIAQAAPGPNILFVALMGWTVGMNSGSVWQAAMGVVVIMSAIMLPSSVLTYFAARWLHKNRELRPARAFKQGMAPVVVGLLLATGWVLASANPNPSTDWTLWLVTIATALLLWLTRLHILWILFGGAALGWFHLV